MKKFFKKQAAAFIACVVAASAVFPAQTWPKPAAAASVDRLTTSPSRVSVHDPSIMEAVDGTYYVFGTHIDAAKSTDLVNWTTFTNGYAAENNALYGNLSQNLSKPFAWAGENDRDSAGGFSVWAPDVFYNKSYINEDGTAGAYMIYFCTSSTATRSVIAYATSQNVEGPYKVVDTVVYSGFTKDSSYDAGSTINTKYTNTNIGSLIDEGVLKDGLNDDWFTPGGGYDSSYAPNAIDPALFWDKDGKLWMAYGSWSGGIYMLEMDPKTGRAIYPGSSSTTADGLVVDEYFGTRVAGGYARSGEGPYVIYDAKTDYYYLYVTYEFLDSVSGYNMRLFRSKSPNGPYYDAAGNNAALSEGQSHDGVGIKVMGNYKFSSLEQGYRSPGHNSALIDSDGQRYLFYHTRFENSGELHQLRVHQQFINEEGWPVTAVFENRGDYISQTGYDVNKIAGDYEFINHGTQSDKANVLTPKNISLNADGSISGDASGSWKEKDGSYMMTAVVDGVAYNGVFFAQHDESAECVKVMTFTAIGSDNKTIWGVKKTPYAISDSEILKRAADEVENLNAVSPKTLSDIALPSTAYGGAAVVWESDNPSVISNDGKVTRPKEAVKTTLTATISYAGKSVIKTFSTTVLPADVSPDYMYDFESVNGTSVANTGDTDSPAALVGGASIEKEPLIGNVLKVKNESGATDSCLSLPSDMFSKIDESGFTLGMWVNFSSSTAESSPLFEAKSTSSYDGLPMTALHAGAYADFISHEARAQGELGLSPDPGEWTHIAYAVDRSGVKVYVNGKMRSGTEADLSAAFNNGAISQIKDARVGGGDAATALNASFDDVEFYSVALGEADISSKYAKIKGSHPNIALSLSKSVIYSGGDKNKTAKAGIAADADIDYLAAYSSSNEAVAAADASSGLISAKKPGKAVITASITANGETFALTKKITVKKAFLKFSKKPKSVIKAGKKVTFKVKGYGLKANRIKWSSSNKSVISINSKGKAESKKRGTAKITAKYKGFKVSMKIKVKK